MKLNVILIFNSILLGIGLACDAFSVSLANGLNDPKMDRQRMVLIAGTFGVFQFAMPLTGWLCVHTIAELFSAFQKYIPWIALILLFFIGAKMIFEAVSNKADDNEPDVKVLSVKLLMIQGIATSIDALSVGFAISAYGFVAALVSTVIVGVVTFIICMAGLTLGKKFGTKLASKASIFGGLILIGIGIEIVFHGIF